MEWKEGSVVRLKSGGPQMTILIMESKSLFLCGWFDKDNNFHKQYFSKEILSLMEDQ